jgi:hypothetical protein
MKDKTDGTVQSKRKTILSLYLSVNFIIFSKENKGTRKNIKGVVGIIVSLIPSTQLRRRVKHRKTQPTKQKESL